MSRQPAASADPRAPLLFHADIFTHAPEPLPDVSPGRSPRTGTDVPRAPWRKVVACVRLRRGWAAFLECQGHVAFIDALHDVRGDDVAHGHSAPVGAGPKKMRCATCVGAEHPLDRKKPTPEEVSKALGRKQKERDMNAAASRFVAGLRQKGSEAMCVRVAEACARKAGQKKFGQHPHDPVDVRGHELVGRMPAGTRGWSRSW